jgi:hypothetical protein
MPEYIETMCLILSRWTMSGLFFMVTADMDIAGSLVSVQTLSLVGGIHGCANWFLN